MPKIPARPNALRSSRVAWAGVLLGAGFLGGCSALPQVIPPIPQPPTAVEIAANDKAAAARSRSLERAVAGINAKTVTAWINRYSAPARVATAKAGPRAIRIDVDSLARRHAAWLLADDLQRETIAPTDARQIGVRVPSLAPVNPTKNVAGELAIPNINALPTRAARSVTATLNQRPAIAASRATLDDFLSDLRTRQNDLEVAESDLARRALEGRIRAATRGAVEAISLTPVSPETALELSNLRLQLLEQLSVPVAQKAAAAAKIEAIEKRLNDIWERQTQEQNARLRAAFEELPARLRREGLAALDAAATKRESERYYARLELRQLVENRLNSNAPGASDTQILRLLLPQARLADTNLSVNANSSFPTNARRSASAASDNDGDLANARDNRSLSQTARTKSENIAQLRAQARRDAKQWANQLAIGWGARLSNETGAPDRTALALQKLFAISSG